MLCSVINLKQGSDESMKEIGRNSPVARVSSSFVLLPLPCMLYNRKKAWLWLFHLFQNSALLTFAERSSSICVKIVL